MRERGISETNVKKVIINYFETKNSNSPLVIRNVVNIKYLSDNVIELTLTNGVKNVIPLGSNIKTIDIIEI